MNLINTTKEIFCHVLQIQICVWWSLFEVLIIHCIQVLFFCIVHLLICRTVVRALVVPISIPLHNRIKYEPNTAEKITVVVWNVLVHVNF